MVSQVVKRSPVTGKTSDPVGAVPDTAAVTFRVTTADWVWLRSASEAIAVMT